MARKWVIKDVEDASGIHRLSRELNDLPIPLATALYSRGIESFEQARLYFRPCLSQLHDPFLMADMDKAVDRIIEAANGGERVLVYGDYDVDGTTATSLMVTFLKSLGLDTVYFIPDRYRDGYGLVRSGLEFAIRMKASVIVALDCGITAVEAAQDIKAAGIDLIICDHHNPGERLPEATAVLDPKRSDCAYPFEALSGCGVGFKLITAVLQRLGRPAEEAWSYLDLVALSIASDVVPMNGENRILMREGLDRIRNSPRLSLKVLAEEVRMDLTQCNTGKIVFGLAPRINAAGRLAHAKKAVELLLACETGSAAPLAHEIETINLERREIDTRTMEQAVAALEGTARTCSRDGLVLYQEDWHVGVIGIVASRIVEKYYRPAVMLTKVGDVLKGSARSISGFNLYEALSRCEHLLLRFGGHKYAAGMTLRPDNLEAFVDTFDEVVRSMMTPDLLIQRIKVDAHLELNEITPRFRSVLKQFQPFGPANLSPVFHAQNLEVMRQPIILRGGHLKFEVRDEAGTHDPFSVIGFHKHALFPQVRDSHADGIGLDMVFTVEENSHRGRTNAQLKLKDARLAD